MEKRKILANFLDIIEQKEIVLISWGVVDARLSNHELEDILEPLIENVRPDLIFYLSGVDILDSDKLGRLSVSKKGCKMRDQHVFELCKKLEIPVAVSMGGGYSEKLADTIDAHANTYRVAVDYFGA